MWRRRSEITGVEGRGKSRIIVRCCTNNMVKSDGKLLLCRVCISTAVIFIKER